MVIARESDGGSVMRTGAGGEGDEGMELELEPWSKKKKEGCDSGWEKDRC